MKIRIFPTVAPESRRFYISTLLITTAITLFLQLQSNGAVGKLINRQIFHPVVFYARSVLTSAKLDPRIKVFAFDDSTVAYLKATDINLTEWGTVIQALTQQPNTHFLIDKLFDNHPQQTDVANFVTSMQGIKSARTGLITFAHPGVIRFRDAVPNEITRNLQKRIFEETPQTLKSLDSSKVMTLYGAPTPILESFTVLGTANYTGDNYISPFVSMESGDIVPNAALSLIGGLSMSDDGFKMNQVRLPLNHEGKLLINFHEPSIYRSAAQSLLPVITRIRSGMDLPILKPGDYIIVLPAMYTGHTDFVDSPFGSIPGGFHLAALIHSALNNDWITDIHDLGFFVILSAVVAFIIGYKLKPSMALGLILLLALCLSLASVATFVYASVAISFVLPVAGLFIGGLNGVILNSHSSALEEARKTRELEVAALVQKSFFPRTTLDPIQTSACKIVGMFESASECGGDWWGSFSKNGYTYVFMGDAVGHGVPAALVTSVAFAVTRAIEIEIDRAVDKILPSEILMVLNEVLTSMGSALAQMTFFVARITNDTGECVFANGGNQPPILIPAINPDGDADAAPRLTLLSSAGNMLGEYGENVFQNHSISLNDGDKIIMFTDGIYENRAASERSQLGKAWLRTTIQEHGRKHLDQFSIDLWCAYKQAIGPTPPDDDTTVVIIEFNRNRHT